MCQVRAAFFAAVFFAAAGAGAYAQGAADSLSRRGDELLKEGNYDAAVTVYSRFLQMSPNAATAYANRGFAYLKKKDYDKAISDLGAAIRLNPRLTDAYNDRGQAYILKRPHDYAAAAADFETVLRLDPAYPRVRQLLEQARLVLNRENLPASANDSAATAAALERQVAGSGMALIQNGDYDKAIADLDATIRQNPNSAAAYFSRGLAYSGKDDFSHAIADLNRAIQLNPNNADAYLLRGSALAISGDGPDKVITELNEAVRLNPNSAEAYYLRGAAYSNKGDYSKAVADFEAALRINPRHTDARHGLVEAQFLKK
jgi:tetratricopeptide (TPR) repeat protein